MTPKEIIDELEELTNGEAILYPDYEEALIGILRQFGRPPVALYDYRKCVNLIVKEGASYEEALEWIEFNSLGAWVGDYTPAFAFT